MLADTRRHGDEAKASQDGAYRYLTLLVGIAGLRFDSRWRYQDSSEFTRFFRNRRAVDEHARRCVELL